MLAIVQVRGQITLQQADIGAIGSTFLNAIDTVVGSFNYGTGGANQNWDFTSLAIHESDTVVFEDPQNTPFASDFPNSDLAIYQNSLGGYAFFDSDPAYLELLGFAADLGGFGMNIVAPMNPTSIIVEFPFTYQDAYLDTSQVDVTADASFTGFADSIRYQSTVWDDVVADGWGTLDLHAGSYNCLRVKRITTTNDKIWGYTFGIWIPFQDTTYTDSTFTYWDKTHGFVLAEVQYEGGDLTQVSYFDPNPVAVFEGLDEVIRVYPNPAQQVLNIGQETAAAKEIRIRDLQGRLLRTQVLDGPQSTVALDGLANGMYVYELWGNEEKMMQTGKFMVQR